MVPPMLFLLLIYSPKARRDTMLGSLLSLNRLSPVLNFYTNV